MEESGIKEDKEFSESCQYSEVCLFSLWHLIACVTHLTHLAKSSKYSRSKYRLSVTSRKI